LQHRRSAVNLPPEQPFSASKTTLSNLSAGLQRDALFVSNRLMDANDVAKSIQKNLQCAVAEWNQSQNALARERQRFEKVCQKLNDAINLRDVHWYIIGTLIACVAALLFGHYVWHH
jgi:hypothetical protein